MLGAMSNAEPSPITAPDGIAEVEANTHAPEHSEPQVLVITGMSGAGRSRAAAVLEDLDWYVVDNLPPMMLVPLVDLMAKGSSIERVAVVVDVRGRHFFPELDKVLAHMTEAKVAYRILFLDASDEVLVRRFESVRRPHPLQGDGRILDGIGTERRVLASLAERADVVIDTSVLSVHDLAKEVRDAIVGSAAHDALRVNVLAFGFKYGIPLDADHVVDVRFLANPYWITELRHLTGRDEAVRQYVLERPGALEFVDRYVAALEPVLAGYLAEEKRYVTIAVGCTGGKHRSVAIAGEIAERLRVAGQQVTVTARDLGKE
jgi:UPF0042 nucleotide-binding protein